MTPFGCQGCGVAVEVDGVLLHQQRGDGFEGHAEIDILTVADATLDAAAVIAYGRDTAVYGTEGVVLLRAAGCNTLEALAIFEALDGVDAQHRCA